MKIWVGTAFYSFYVRTVRRENLRLFILLGPNICRDRVGGVGLMFYALCFIINLNKRAGQIN